MKKEFILEEKYMAVIASAIYDDGLKDADGGERYHAIVGIDTDKNGVIEKEDKELAKILLNEKGRKFGTVIPKSLCLGDLEGTPASDDRVTFLDRGVTFKHELFETNKIKFMLSAGLILPTRFIKYLDNEKWEIDFEKILKSTPRNDEISTAGFVNIPEKYKDGYYKAKTIIDFVAGSIGGNKSTVSNILFSITDYLLEKKIVEFSDSKER